MKVILVAGARPNFMKIAPIIEAINNKKKDGKNIEFKLVHTGQHYDNRMSGSFFDNLGIPKPDINLEAGGGTQSEQTANIMIRFEKYLSENLVDLVLVVGDVTSTMACAIVAQKLHVKVGHIEAGIRSNDWDMPEEINRLVTDSITNYFFTTSTHANQNLLNSGVSNDRIFFVGNTMIDTLKKNQKKFKKPNLWDQNSLRSGDFFVLTLHRPANVDDKDKLKSLLEAISISARNLKVVFPTHPRTSKILASLDFRADNLIQTDPLDYFEFNYLVSNAKAVITDSGGITEETTVLGVPCITLRNNTERPETCEIGTNELIGTNPEAIPKTFNKLFSGNWKKGAIPDKWDGNAANRVVEHLLDIWKL